MNYIETDRLILRAWKPEDLPLFVEMNRDERVMRYFPTTLTDKQTESFYNRIQSEFEWNGWGLYAVELKSTGKESRRDDKVRYRWCRCRKDRRSSPRIAALDVRHA